MSNSVESILERLEAIVSGLNKKMADKNDTKKALKLLEKQVSHTLLSRLRICMK